jgi:hypothetical protein
MSWRRAVTVGMQRVFLGSMHRRRPGATHARPGVAGVRQAGQHPRTGTGKGSRAGGARALQGSPAPHSARSNAPTPERPNAPTCSNLLQPAPTPPSWPPPKRANATQKGMQWRPPTPRRRQAERRVRTALHLRMAAVDACLLATPTPQHIVPE